VSVSDSDRQRLIVALVQKKVSEILGSAKFNNSFQIGMLASFESFPRDDEGKPKGDDEATVFDDAEQTDDEDERLRSGRGRRKPSGSALPATLQARAAPP